MVAPRLMMVKIVCNNFYDIFSTEFNDRENKRDHHKSLEISRLIR
jgi:hypothetical protein